MPSYHLKAIFLPYGDQPADLWIVDGRITFTPKDDAEELAAPGGYVLAGLVDCHAHLTLGGEAKELPGDSRELVDSNRLDHLRAGVLLLRDIGAVSGATLGLRRGGLPPVRPGSLFLAPEDGSPFPVDPVLAKDLPAVAVDQVKAGAEWVKIMGDWPGGPWPPDWGRDRSNYPPDVLAATVEAVHKVGGRVAVHTMGASAAAAGVVAGVDSIEHGWSLDEDILGEMAERAIAWTPTLIMGPFLIPQAEANDQPSAVTWIRESMERLQYLVPIGHQIGVQILAGTDALRGSIAREVVALHEFGLEPADALSAASASARAFLGEPDLEEGAPADLVLYRNDPREYPEVLQNPELIMLEGERIRIEELE